MRTGMTRPDAASRNIHPAPPARTAVGESAPPQRKLAGANAGGSPLPDAVQRKMEGAFGHDFSRVRVHHGDHAESIGAQAYAQGEHIHFARGRYSPHTNAGQRLLGHELAHVVQQRAGRVAAPQGKGLPINDDRALEAEADAMGARAAAGSPVRGGMGARAASPAAPALQRMPIQRAAKLRKKGKKGIAQRLKNRDKLRLDYITDRTVRDFRHVDFKAAKRHKYRNILYGRINERALKYHYKNLWNQNNPQSKQSGFLDTNRLLGNSGGVDGVMNNLLLQSKMSWKGTPDDQVQRLAGFVRKVPFDAAQTATFLRSKKKGEPMNWFEKLHQMHQGSMGAPRTTASTNPNHQQRFQGILPPTLASLSPTATKKELSETILPLMRYAVPSDRVTSVKDYLDNSRSSHFHIKGVQHPYSSLVTSSGVSTSEAHDIVDELETKHLKYT